jgi:FkbM family methyltransferase
MQLHLRQDTWDLAILDHVLGGEYGPLDFADKTVLDIGAHIGVFSAMAAAGGARRVLAFEAGGENYRLLVENCRPFAAIECRHAAVWRSDLPASPLQWRAPARAENTGGGTVLTCTHVAGEPVAPSQPTRVPAIALDTVLSRVGHVDVLKIDAEGSEYPVLLTSRLLPQVALIVGEYHRVDGAQAPGADGWTLPVLASHLRAQGFQVRHEDRPDNGRFVAARGG